MPTSIYFAGRRINVPQAVSKLDTSALSAVSPAAVGIVALVGTAEGGKPLTVEEEFSDHTRSDSVRETYRSGNLLTAGLFAFEPSADPAVPGGAQSLVAVKVNPATQSTATLPDASANDSVDLTSADYGQFTEQVNIEVATGTNQGKKLTLTFEDSQEIFDDVGGDAIFDVLYTPGASGYTTALGSISATQFLVAATKATTGLNAERTADLAAPDLLDVISSAAGDTTQTVTVYGLTALNVPIKETIALNGTTAVSGLTTFASVLSVELSAAAVGTVLVRRVTGSVTLFSLAPAVLRRGMVKTTNTPAAGVATVSIDVDTAVDVVVRGLNSAGAAIAERFDMTTGNTTPVVGTTVFASITQLDLGDVSGARTITTAIAAVKTLHSVFPTVTRVVDRLNSLDGFTANALVSNSTTFLMSDADYSPAVSVLVAANFYADLFTFIDVINVNSQLIDAARATGASLVPANTVAPVFLVGGSEGTTTITQWQAAFDLLKKRRVNIIVPLTNDPAVHNLLLTHLIERAGRLRSEANGYVGLGTNAGAGETLSNITSQIQALASRHISAVAQEVKRFDPITGLATFYPPHMAAAVAAGMQAGTPIGEPLTHKQFIALDLRNDSSWTVEDEIEFLIDSGLMVAEKVDGLGIRWVRSITTHLADDNPVFTEMSTNESANTAVFELRRRLELKIGQRGLGGTVGVLKGLALAALNDLVTDEIIVAHRALQVEQIGDVFPISVEIAPVNPINFIPITVHLVSVRTAA